MMFLWVIVPTKYVSNIEIERLGKDYLTHTLFHWHTNYQWYNGNDPDIIIPHINIDSGQHLKRIWAIKSGMYAIVAHWHKGKEEQAYHAFHIMRWYKNFEQERITERSQYGNKYRKDLPMIDGTTVDYINFHRTAKSYDGSGGCFTMLPQFFDIFRKSFRMCEKGIMLYLKE